MVGNVGGFIGYFSLILYSKFEFLYVSMAGGDAYYGLEATIFAFQKGQLHSRATGLL